MQSVIAISLLFGMMLGDGRAFMSKNSQTDGRQAQPLTDCVKTVRCDRIDSFGCWISLDINENDRKCQIIFGDAKDTNVTTLYIRGTVIEVPDAVNKFDNLTKLILADVGLREVERSKLVAFSRIRSLNLQENSITQLAADTFDDLEDLSWLDLNFNNLKTIHRDVFQQLHNLEELGLGYNQLEVLPDDLFRNNRKLKQKLNLHGNKIRVLHRDVFLALHDLKRLDLAFNQLEVLPDGLFRNNRKLVKIELFGNKIRVLHPDVFKDLRDLKELSLSSNQVEVLSDGLFRDNQALEYIWLSDNKIRKIECNFYNLPNLQTIYLRNNLCISESCSVKSFCGTTSMTAMHEMIWSKCPNGT